MQCSLYGKLPARRDFVAIGAPRAFLDAWEPWIQAAISASRTRLGESWQAAFLTAPIWRFWLGAEVCGRSAIGAVMSSLDGVGRYFPLTLFACADDGAAIPPPELVSQDDWFDAVEAFLMATLDHTASFETVSSGLGGLATPVQESADRPSHGMVGSGVGRPADGESFGDVFAALRRRDHARVYAGSTFWWTVGGEGFAPAALCERRMPDPYRFAQMLTGDLTAAAV